MPGSRPTSTRLLFLELRADPSSVIPSQCELIEQGRYMKIRVHTPIVPQFGSPLLHSVSHGKTCVESRPRPSDVAQCLFQVFLTLPHDIPYVRQHLHDSVVNFCPTVCPQSVRIDLEQKPHGTHYRIHACLADSELLNAASDELAYAVKKVTGANQPAAVAK